jgi:two-component system nitrogen regulation response regulator GlnG
VTASSLVPPPQVEVSVSGNDFSVDDIIGKSKTMQDIFKTIGKAAVTQLPVLLTGESGTGKEMVARALHFYSDRVKRPFIFINCAAISRELLESELFGHEKGAFTGAVEAKKGKFELADNGTILLDEIGDMEIALQAKILRVLQNNEFYRVGGKEPLRVDVRVIAATNQDLKELMDQKRFREDLYHRLNVINIHLPPLRERTEDIPLLANFFLKKFSGELTRGQVFLSPKVEHVFKNYHWFGNIRELENVIKRGMVLASSGPLLLEHLPLNLQADQPATEPIDISWDEEMNPLVKSFLKDHFDSGRGQLHDLLIETAEKHLFEQLLQKNRGNQVATAKDLGINRNTLKRKIDAMNIEPKKKKEKPSF